MNEQEQTETILSSAEAPTLPKETQAQSEAGPKPDYFETVHGKRMHYEPGSIVGSSDAFYIVQKGGNWLKFAQLHRKKGWQLLRMNQELLDHALAEVARMKALDAARAAAAVTPGEAPEGSLPRGDTDEVASVLSAEG